MTLTSFFLGFGPQRESSGRRRAEPNAQLLSGLDLRLDESVTVEATDSHSN